MNETTMIEAAASSSPKIGELYPPLIISQLSAGYAGNTILNGLDLSVGTGEIFGLLGSNGSGKTTLIRTICGRIHIRSGTVELAGKKIDRGGKNNAVGLVPQEIALYPFLSVRENLELFGQLSGLDRKDISAASSNALESTGLTERADDIVETLSGGYKRRANIAAAILHQPSIILFDEPTVGVDIDARHGLHDVIRKLKRSGAAIILTTHDMSQAEALCDRVGFLRDGILSPVGTPEELVKEKFGNKREVVIAVRSTPSERQSARLSKAGFHSAKNGLEWSALFKMRPNDEGKIAQTIHKAGIDVHEIRFRQPGLDSLFMSLVREDAL
ncbi:MAG: ABC transporter ATP-binding protein [Rhizobiaceae bacterium]